MAIFQSNFVFGLQGKRYQDFVDSVAKPIIEKVIGTDDYEIVNSEYHLSEQDFNKTQRENSIFPDFYQNFLNDINKSDSKIFFKKKVCICLDERLCRDICSNTGRKFATIKLANIELAYFIYFDIKEFFDFIYHEPCEITENKQNIEVINKDHNNNYQSPENNITIVDENKSISIDSSLSLEKLFQPNNLNYAKNEKIVVNNSNDLIITKIGYIHNHNYNDKFSFIRTSIDRKQGFLMPYKIFPDVKELAIGTVIKAKCIVNNEKVIKVQSYNIGSESDLDFSFEEFEGILKRKKENNFAFVKNYGQIIYVPASLAKNFEVDRTYNVQCYAVQSLSNDGRLSWEALQVIEILS